MKKNEHKNTVVILFSIFLGMLGLSYASVPIYRIFCQKTGFGGTTKTAKSNPLKISNRKMEILFTANVHRDLNWDFKPLQTSIKVRIGEPGLAFYWAKNLDSKAIVGMATYNVSPDKAGKYFNKVHCFCFEEQKMLPGQSMEMPVQFFIDPSIEQDPYLDDVQKITLSYTFFILK